MSGHRRLANALLDLHHPGDLRPWTPLEFLLILDQVETRGESLTISAWCRACGRSRSWVNARVNEYAIEKTSLRQSKRQSASGDSQAKTRSSAIGPATKRQRAVNTKLKTDSKPIDIPHLIEDTGDKIHDVGTRQLMDLAELLAVSVRTRYPGAVRPAPKRLKAWAKEIGKIPVPPEEIAATIQWLFSPANEGEFCFVVQSGSALREKYGRITAKMEKPEHGKDGHTPGKIESAARNVAAKIGLAGA